MCVVIIFTEVLIVLKFDWETVTKPFPLHVTIFWIGFLFVLFAWTVWHFYIKQFIRWQEKKIEKQDKKSK